MTISAKARRRWFENLKHYADLIDSKDAGLAPGDEAVAVQTHDAVGDLITPATCGRYLMIQSDGHDECLYDFDRIEDLEHEIGIRVDEEYWSINTLVDLERNQELTYTLTAKVRDAEWSVRK